MPKSKRYALSAHHLANAVGAHLPPLTSMHSPAQVTGHRSDCYRTYERPTMATSAALNAAATSGLPQNLAPPTPQAALSGPAPAHHLLTAPPPASLPGNPTPSSLQHPAAASSPMPTAAMLQVLCAINAASMQAMFPSMFTPS